MVKRDFSFTLLISSLNIKFFLTVKRIFYLYKILQNINTILKIHLQKFKSQNWNEQDFDFIMCGGVVTLLEFHWFNIKNYHLESRQYHTFQISAPILVEHQPAYCHGTKSHTVVHLSPTMQRAKNVETIVNRVTLAFFMKGTINLNSSCSP